MPNPYGYTRQEIDDLVIQWEHDNYIVYNLKDFIMYETKFSEDEYEQWRKWRLIP